MHLIGNDRYKIPMNSELIAKYFQDFQGRRAMDNHLLISGTSTRRRTRFTFRTFSEIMKFQEQS